MSRDKQIEEMAKDIDIVMQSRCCHKRCNECEFDRYNTCKSTMLADALVNDYGYRKPTDVAEIFEKLENVIVGTQYGEAKILISEFLKLKKKYTEEE